MSQLLKIQGFKIFFFYFLFTCVAIKSFSENVVDSITLINDSIRIIQANSALGSLSKKNSFFSLSFFKDSNQVVENAILMLELFTGKNELPEEVQVACYEILGDIAFFGNFSKTPNFTQAKEYYSKLLLVSNNTYSAARAHFHLALIEEENLTYNGSFGTSIIHLMTAGSLLYPPANMALGYKYLHGKGVIANRHLAANFYLLACNSTVYDTEFEIVPSFSKNIPIRLDSLGEERLSQNLNAKPDVIRFYELTSNGNVDVQLALGQNFFHGLVGESPDYTAARKYFEMAAEEYEDALALSYLGLMALRGLGYDDSNAELSYTYFDRAIEADDHSLAWFGLGLLYYEGAAVEYDEKEAIACWTKAADRGLSEAQYKLGSYLLRNRNHNTLLFLDKSGIKHTRALLMLQAASSAGNQKAIYELAEYMISSHMDFGAGDPLAYLTVCAERSLSKIYSTAYQFYESRQYSNAIICYMLSSFMGYEVGHLNMAFLLQNAPGNASGRHLSYLLSAYEFSKSVDSMIYLGDHYYYASLKLQDPSLLELAVDFYVKAEKAGNARAAFNLGYCYENGKGVPQNFEQARRFYNLVLLHDDSATIPVSLVLFKLKLKELLYFSQQPHFKSYYKLNNVNTTGNQIQSIFRKFSSFSLPSKRIVYSYSKKIWFYLQKIIITLLSVLAAVIYFRNYLRLVREERDRQAQNVIPQPQSSPPSASISSNNYVKLPTKVDLTSSKSMLSSPPISNEINSDKKLSSSSGISSFSPTSIKANTDPSSRADTFLELAKEYQRRAGMLSKDSTSRTDEEIKQKDEQRATCSSSEEISND